MATLEIFRDTNERIAKADFTHAYVRARATVVAVYAQGLLNTRSKVRTFDSNVVVEDAAYPDVFVTLLDHPDRLVEDADRTAAIISYQHNILWDAVTAFGG